MLNNDYIEKLLGLKDIIVTKVEDIGYDKHIHLKLHVKPNYCPSCGSKTTKIHDYREQIVKDVDIVGMHTYFHLRKRRYRCEHCNKRFQEKNTFLPKYQRTTNRLWFHTINLLRDVKSMKQVAREVNLSPTSVARIFDKVHYSAPKLPKVIGLDEFKGNSGGEKFNCILTDPSSHVILDILPKRKAESLYEYFSQFKNRNYVEIVTMDMSILFKTVVKASFPKAKIVADKYHVVRQVTWAFENVRKRIQSDFVRKHRVYMKNSRKLLLKRQRNLSEDEMLEVAKLLRYSKELGTAYYLKERFYEFMESKDVYEAERKLSEWFMHAKTADIPEFNATINTMVNWKEEILNAFRFNITNGYTEGCNNLIKVIKRTGYGLRNFNRFRNRILHIVGS